MTKPTSKSVTVIGLRTDVLIALEKKGGNNEKGRHIMPLNSISTTYPTKLMTIRSSCTTSLTCKN